MRLLTLVFPWILMFFLSGAVASGKGQVTKESLDAACQAAREAKLVPVRQQRVDDCVKTKEKKDRATCERYYRDWGERSGRRAGMFFDLPECVEAQNFRK